MAARKRRRRKLPALPEWGSHVARAILIAVDWFVNGGGSK